MFLEIGSVLTINAHVCVEQYLGAIIPKFHSDMAFPSLCKIDSSTGRYRGLNSLSYGSLKLPSIQSSFYGAVRPIVLLIEICLKFAFFSFAKKLITFQPLIRFL